MRVSFGEETYCWLNYKRPFTRICTSYWSLFFVLRVLWSPVWTLNLLLLLLFQSFFTICCLLFLNTLQFPNFNEMSESKICVSCCGGWKSSCCWVWPRQVWFYNIRDDGCSKILCIVDARRRVRPVWTSEARRRWLCCVLGVELKLGWSKATEHRRQ